MTVGPSDALIVVDVQNDFCPGGALPVEGGPLVVPVINRLLGRIEHQVFTRDWHPPDHCSFDEVPEFRDGSWPAHCLADSPGAQFHGDMFVPSDAFIVSKATEPDEEAYSGFQDTGLAVWLRARGVTRLFVCGLATDYCVKHTALDGLEEGFEVVVVKDGCRAVNKQAGEAALEEMKAAGAAVCVSSEVGA